MRLTYLSGALAGVLVAACGGTPLTPEDPPPSQTEPDLHPMTASAATALDESKCAEGGVRQRPFVVNWDATDQAAFSAHIQDSLALVKAEGCKLELLPLCTIPGEYRLHETDGNLQSLTIGSEDQLYAELPLGFASLSGHLKQSGSLSLRYFVRGTKTATGARLYRSQLGDGCEGATHLVVNYAAGAYELASTSGHSAGGKASALGASAGAETSGSTEALFRGGDMTACQSGAKHCTAPIRLWMMPIADGEPPPAEAPAAALAVTKPVVPQAEQKLSREDQMKYLSAARAALSEGVAACIVEFPPDWAKVSDPEGALQLSTMFGQDGTPMSVKATRSGLVTEEAENCARDALWSARYPATGGPKENVAGWLSFKTKATRPICNPATHLAGWRCVPDSGDRCPDGMQFFPEAGCACASGTQYVAGKGCTGG